MKDIKIFVAGSKELVAERKALKLIIPDMNTEYAHANINLRMITYENYSDNQTAYNRFITEEADIVIFILDGEIKDKTEEELLLAAKKYRLNNHPEIFIFVKKPTDYEVGVSPKMSYIEGLLKGAFDSKYYKEYTEKDDYESLKDAAKTRIRRYIGSRKERQAQKMKRIFRGLILPVAVGAVCLLAAVNLYCYYTDNKIDKEEPLLVISGGGSAKSYVEQYYLQGRKIEYLDSIMNSIYIHMASKNAWQFLFEELIYSKTDQDRRRNRVSKKYVPVCLSASEMKPQDVRNFEDNPKFLENGSIVGIKLGIDSLMVYAPDCVSCIADRISAADLRKLILSKEKKYAYGDSTYIYTVYTTNDNSGTLSLYQETLGITIDDKLTNRRVFSDITDFGTSKDKNVIFLGSGLYKPHLAENKVKEGSASKAMVIDNGDAVCKPIYVYFVVSRDNGMLEIPQEALDFLNLLVSSESEMLKVYPDLNTFLQTKLYQGRYLVSRVGEEVVYTVDDFLDNDKIPVK